MFRGVLYEGLRQCLEEFCMGAKAMFRGVLYEGLRQCLEEFCTRC